MLARITLAAVVVLLLPQFAWAQQLPPATAPLSNPLPGTATVPPGNAQWRNPSSGPNGVRVARNPADISGGPIGGGQGGLAPLEPLKQITTSPRKPISRVTAGPATLPNEQGQVWREYDISSYTMRVTTTNRPEQAIVDWILRETGYEAWHSEPIGILSATKRSLKVYHTPEMHAVILELVDRFVTSEAESQAFGLRVMTIANPNWRIKAHPLLHPVAVQTQGIQAWLLQKEEAALLLADLRKRSDFREHSSPHMLVNNGQSAVVAATRGRTYTRDVIMRPGAIQAIEPEIAQFDEGFSLELNPLLSLDGRSVDAVIKCNIDQLEKLIPIMLDTGTSLAPRQRTKIEVPQAVHCRLHERFRWPTDQVLVVGLGVVAPPTPSDPNPLAMGLPVLSAAARADLLVMVECKGKVTPVSALPQTTSREPTTYRGRY
jgi:hypothetical protein